MSIKHLGLSVDIVDLCCESWRYNGDESFICTWILEGHIKGGGRRGWSSARTTWVL